MVADCGAVLSPGSCHLMLRGDGEWGDPSIHPFIEQAVLMCLLGTRHCFLTALGYSALSMLYCIGAGVGVRQYTGEQTSEPDHFREGEAFQGK